MAGNLALKIGWIFSGHPVSKAGVKPGDILVEFDPVINRAPEWQGVADIHFDEDSPWTPLLDLDVAFTDDHNQAELVIDQGRKD